MKVSINYIENTDFLFHMTLLPRSCENLDQGSAFLAAKKSKDWGRHGMWTQQSWSVVPFSKFYALFSIKPSNQFKVTTFNEISVLLSTSSSLLKNKLEAFLRGPDCFALSSGGFSWSFLAGPTPKRSLKQNKI